MFEFDEFICFLLRVFVGKNFCSEFWLGQAQYYAKSYWLLISCFRPFVSEFCGIVWMPNYLFRLCIYCLIEIRSAFLVNSCLSIMFGCKSCPKHWTLRLGCSYSLTGSWYRSGWLKIWTLDFISDPILEDTVIWFLLLLLLLFFLCLSVSFDIGSKRTMSDDAAWLSFMKVYLHTETNISFSSTIILFIFLLFLNWQHMTTSSNYLLSSAAW